MIGSLDNTKINTLYRSFHITDGEREFNELFNSLQGMVYHQARKYERDTGIPRENFVSRFRWGIWKAVQNKDLPELDGSSNFTQRLNHIFRQGAIDEIRYTKRDKRAFKADSLDEELRTVENARGSVMNTLTRRDTVSVPYSLADEVEDRESVSELFAVIESFSQVSERYGKAIKLLAAGATTDEIAAAFDSEKYDARIRKIVERARAAFKEYLDASRTSQAVAL